MKFCSPEGSVVTRGLFPRRKLRYVCVYPKVCLTFNRVQQHLQTPPTDTKYLCLGAYPTPDALIDIGSTSAE